MPAMNALTGANYLYLAPVTKDTAEEYAVGTAMRFTGLMTVGANQSSSGGGESNVAADDDANWYTEAGAASSQTERKTITIGEIPLEHLAKLTGAKYDSATKTLSYNPEAKKTIPPYALSYASIQSDNSTYRMFKYYKGAINNVDYGDITTRSGSASVANVTIDITFSRPMITDADMKKEQDGALSTTYLQDFTDYEALGI